MKPHFRLHYQSNWGHWYAVEHLSRGWPVIAHWPPPVWDHTLPGLLKSIYKAKNNVSG